MKVFKLIILVLAILTTNISFGQNDAETMMFGQSNVSKSKGEKVISSSVDKYINDVSINDKLIISPKKMSNDFTGYTIRVKLSEGKVLPLTDNIFKEFGKVKIDKDLKENYIYLVGNFKKESLAYDYLMRIVSPRYPLACVIQYENGQIIE